MKPAFACKFCTWTSVTFSEAYYHMRQGGPHRTYRVEVDHITFNQIHKREIQEIQKREREQIRLRHQEHCEPSDGLETEEFTE